MGLRDMLKKKERVEDDGGHHKEAAPTCLQPPQFTFMRSDTHSQEVIQPPSGVASREDTAPTRAGGADAAFPTRKRGLSAPCGTNIPMPPDKGGPTRGISQRLHLRRAPAASDNVPKDLREIVAAGGEDDAEKQWEERATILAKTANEKERQRSRPSSRGSTDPDPPRADGIDASLGGWRLSSDQARTDGVNSAAIDADIQQAIRLHEGGELEESTRLFGILADPNGANNPLSQVLYGLALRHGWGCEPSPAEAVFYLSEAAKNAADVESLALQAGLKKGGAAKGELVLAIFELANCFRHGWGINKDPIAAKQYYETAANLGDTDAMDEVAWCYLEGFGCKKDKFSAAKYFRLAEKNGNKTLGNSWIWKDKYNPENKKGKN